MAAAAAVVAREALFKHGRVLQHLHLQGTRLRAVVLQHSRHQQHQQHLTLLLLMPLQQPLLPLLQLLLRLRGCHLPQLVKGQQQQQQTNWRLCLLQAQGLNLLLLALSNCKGRHQHCLHRQQQQHHLVLCNQLLL